MNFSLPRDGSRLSSRSLPTVLPAVALQFYLHRRPGLHGVVGSTEIWRFSPSCNSVDRRTSRCFGRKNPNFISVTSSFLFFFFRTSRCALNACGPGAVFNFKIFNAALAGAACEARNPELRNRGSSSALLKETAGIPLMASNGAVTVAFREECPQHLFLHVIQLAEKIDRIVLRIRFSA